MHKVVIGKAIIIELYSLYRKSHNGCIRLATFEVIKDIIWTQMN